jgi:hypothetical protein
MILAVLRAFANDAPLRHLDAGLAIAHTYADHALRFARVHLDDSQPKSAKDRRIAAMLTGVGDTFTSTEAYEAAWGNQFDVSERTLRKDLKVAEQRGLIESTRRGAWKKS